jgi:hypothetical protein
MRRAVGLIGSAAVVGIVAGVLLDIAALLVARYGPQADGWSFRGNGALAIPFGLGPALLAGFWAGLVFRYRGFSRWALLGLAAALVGTAFLLISVLVLVLFNSAAMDVSSSMTFFILGWMVAAPVLAAVTPAQDHRSPHPAGLLRKRADLPTGWGGGQLPAHVGAGAILTVVFFVAFFAAGLVLAPGS